MPTAVAAAALCLLIFQPLAIFQASMQLSFGAVLGISLVGDIFKKILMPSSDKTTVRINRFCSVMGLSIAMLPVLLYHYYQYPLYAILLNQLVIPFAGILLVSPAVALALSLFAPAFGAVCLKAGHLVIYFYTVLCKLSKSLPESAQYTGRPALWRIVLYVTLLFITAIGTSLIYEKRKRKQTDDDKEKLKKDKRRCQIDLRSFLTPEAVSVNISPEQAVLFVRNPILDARHFCTRILNHIKSTFLVDCCIAVTKPLSEYDSFKQAFSALEQQMEQRFFLPDTLIFLPDTTQTQRLENSEDDSELLPLIKNAIAARSRTLLEEYLSHLFDKYKLAVNQSQIYVKFLFSNVLTLLYPAIPDDALCNFSPLEAMIANLYLQPDISEIIRIVKEVSKPVLDSFSAGTDTMRKEVACAISYIANHYSEELSAEVLASAVYLTPDYLSRLFKKATGKSISQYIRQYRMEKAKDALLHTRKKVIDIGIESGYPNYSYFCQSFREYFGSSPEKYRQEHTL